MFIADIRRCDLNDLFYFAMVVEHGGFSQAGRALAMPKSKLSRRIALRSVDPFLKLMASTITVLLTAQAIINIGYVVGLLPVTGIQLPLVSAGGTSTLTVLAMLGFRRIHVYGFDSCIRGGTHHAYSQPENDGVDAIEVVVGGRTFREHGWMLKQAEEFQVVMRDLLVPAGVELAIYGDGLIAAILEAAAAARGE